MLKRSGGPEVPDQLVDEHALRGDHRPVRPEHAALRQHRHGLPADQCGGLLREGGQSGGGPVGCGADDPLARRDDVQLTGCGDRFIDRGGNRLGLVAAAQPTEPDRRGRDQARADRVRALGVRPQRLERCRQTRHRPTAGRAPDVMPDCATTTRCLARPIPARRRGPAGSGRRTSPAVRPTSGRGAGGTRGRPGPRSVQLCGEDPRTRPYSPPSQSILTNFTGDGAEATTSSKATVGTRVAAAGAESSLTRPLRPLPAPLSSNMAKPVESATADSVTVIRDENPFCETLRRRNSAVVADGSKQWMVTAGCRWASRQANVPTCPPMSSTCIGRARERAQEPVQPVTVLGEDLVDRDARTGSVGAVDAQPGPGVEAQASRGHVRPAPAPCPTAASASWRRSAASARCG